MPAGSLITTPTGSYREIYPQELIEPGDADMVVGCSLFYPLGANLVGYPSSTIPITIKDGVRVRRVRVKPTIRAEFKFGEPIPFGFKVISCNPEDNKVFVEEVTP